MKMVCLIYFCLRVDMALVCHSVLQSDMPAVYRTETAVRHTSFAIAFAPAVYAAGHSNDVS